MTGHIITRRYKNNKQYGAPTVRKGTMTLVETETTSDIDQINNMIDQLFADGYTFEEIISLINETASA